MRKIDLRSDTVTVPTDEMRKAMYEAEVGDDVFGEDPTINRLQERTAEILGKEAALYVPSGTMANQIALNILTNEGDEVYCDVSCHLFNYEAGAPSIISRIQLHPIHGERGVFTADQVEAVLRPADHHFCPSRLIAIENTCNRGGGTIWPIREIHNLRDLADENGMNLFLDGARLWNAAAASGTPENVWASHADAINVCFSKGLGAPVGSCIVASKELVDEAHRMRKRLGGGMRQAGIVAAAALFALENHRERLVEDHHNAKKLAEGIAEIPGFSINPEHVHTNIVIVDMSKRGISSTSFAETIAQKGIYVTMAGPAAVRFVTHLGIEEEDIDYVLKSISELY